MLSESSNQDIREKVERLQQEIEDERKEGLKQYNLRAKLERKYDRLAAKYQKIVHNTPTYEGSFASVTPNVLEQNVSQELKQQPRIEPTLLSAASATEENVEQILKLKDCKIQELRDLLQKHEVDVDLLTRELGRFYYKESKRKELQESPRMSPTKRFFSVFKKQVAPNVLVVLIAFFTALSNNDFDNLNS